MWTGQNITITIGGILGIVGILVALWGGRILGHPLKGRFAFVAFGLALSGVGLFIIASESLAYAGAFGLLATFAAVVIALVAIKQTDNLEARRNKQGLTKDINEWAIEIGATILTNGNPPVEDEVRRLVTDYAQADKLIDDRYAVMLKKFTPLRMKSVYIAEIAKTDEELAKLVDVATKHLRAKLRLLHSYVDRRELINRNKGNLKAAINVARNEDRLYGAIVEIIEVVGKSSLM